MSVTMPHKEDVAAAVDSLDPAATALRSVNTVVPQPDGTLRGHSTDGAGFVASLEAAGEFVSGRTVAVLGAGAAARAIIDALARSGASRIAVVNRTPSSAEAAAALAGAVGAVGGVVDVRDADLVVNATSVGMGSLDLPCDASLLRAGQVVADIVYHPRRTALLDAAAAVGARTVEGLGMLVHQAVLQDHPDMRSMQAYACGAPVMVEAARRDFVAQAQLSEDQFYADSFLSAADQIATPP